jgi:hypothetical protein
MLLQRVQWRPILLSRMMLLMLLRRNAFAIVTQIQQLLVNVDKCDCCGTVHVMQPLVVQDRADIKVVSVLSSWVCWESFFMLHTHTTACNRSHTVQ